jgi:ABC-2 type transport system ATP-binding protein
MTALETREVSKRFGDTCAVDSVDLTVERGEVRGLLGPNGAGKTTLLRMLLGLIRPDSGTVELNGCSLGDPRRLEGVAGFVEDPSFYPYLSGRANLAVLAELDGGCPQNEREAALERVGVAGRGDERVAGYSTGMRKRLGLASALMRAPRLLVLDEPTTGLDPAGVRLVGEIARSLAEDGVAVLLSSHQIVEVQDVCDSFTVLRSGVNVWTGTAAEMRAQAPPASNRLATADDRRALEIAAGVPGVSVTQTDAGDLEVEAEGDALDALVLALGGAGIAVRRLEPIAGPLESLFSSLVGAPAGAPTPDPSSPAVRA